MNARSCSFLLFAAALVVFPTACKRGDPLKVSAIDSLLHTTDSLLAQVNAVDMGLYRTMDSTFRGQRSWLEAQFKDTLDRERAQILGNYYRAMNKSVGRVLKEQGTVRSDLATSRDQLADLRHDVERGLLEEGPEGRYLAEERMVLEQLGHNTDVLLRSAATARREWDRHGPRIEPMMRADTLALSSP